jgi:hypothetical protein
VTTNHKEKGTIFKQQGRIHFTSIAAAIYEITKNWRKKA